MKNTEKKYRAPALDRGLDILELLSESDEGWTQSGIASALGCTTNQIYRMLDRLVRRGYVLRTPGDRYELSLKLYAVAYQRPAMHRLISHASIILRRVARATGQSCHMVIPDRGSLIVVAQAESPDYWSVSIRVGAHVGLFNTGSGHVVLAFSSRQARDLLSEEHELLPNEVIPMDLDEQLGKISKEGHVLVESRQTIGVVDISVPVFGVDNELLASLTCPYIKRADNAPTMPAEEVLQMLLAGSSEISESIIPEPHLQ